MKKLSKTLLSCLLILVMLIGIFPLSAFAEDTATVYIGHKIYGPAQYTTFNYTLNDGAHSANISGMNLHYLQSTGQIAYCMAPDTASPKNPTPYESTDPSALWKLYSFAQRQAILKIIAYGAPNGISSTDKWKNWGYEAATQVLIWEIIMGLRNPETFVRTSNTLYELEKNCCTDERAGYVEAYAAIEAKCKAHGSVPSFGYRRAANAEANPITLDYDPATGICSKTLTDTNNAINNDFPFGSVEGLTITKSGNQLTVSCRYEDFVGKEIPTVKAVGSQPDTENLPVVFWTNEDRDQPVCSVGKPDPVQVYLKFKLPELPKISTTAAFESGEKANLPLNSISIVDTVSYENLSVGTEYRLAGTLMDTTGKAIQVNGKAVTAEKTFTPEASNGQIQMTFSVNASALAGKSVVVYEKLYLSDGTFVVGHEDPEDAGQTVSFYAPDIRTSASFEDHTKVSHKTPSVTILDTVSYTDLMPGENYTVKGVLMTRTDSGEAEALLTDGKEVTASTTFTAQAANDQLVMSYTFDASALESNTVVVYETLYAEDGTVLAMHHDINDEEQTVRFTDVSIRTEAVFEDGLKISDPLSAVTIVDTVSCNGLIEGETYLLEGSLAYETVDENGETVYLPVETEDGPITVCQGFVAENAEQTMEMSFSMNAVDYAGKHVVVLEKLYTANVEGQGKDTTFTMETLLAEHTDLTDEAQTVAFSAPELKTTALFDNNSHTYQLKTIKSGEDLPSEVVTLTDTIAYQGLTAGVTYTAEGRLMIVTTAADGTKTVEPLMVNEKEVTATAEFTPEAAEGEAQVVFEFDARELDGKSVVVFESVKRGDEVIAEHADPDDADQTVNFLRTIKTGGLPDWAWIVMAGVLLAIAVILILALRSYKKKH